MIKKFTLYVGLNDKDTKTQLINRLEAFKIITNIFKHYHIEGATIYEAQGLYLHESGEYVTENTFRIELLFVELETVKKAVNDIKIALNQESVAVQEENINSDLW